ncbi:MAG: PRC-barrel domain-containing protein [Syntrophales bacterium]|nr:PRC-barrel domain-containing protein [Syntrophales bacterium]MDY0043671.1 PRC-barrel domain-containing protein [Syntrophales bacterium]
MKKLITLFAVMMMVCMFIGTQAYAADEKAKGAAAGEQMKQETTATGQKMQGQAAGGQMMTGPGQTYRASNIIDFNVKSEQGEELGEVEDVLISADGRVQYVMISRGGVLGIGENLIPVPFKVARINMADDTLVLQGIDKSKLEQAPSFAKDEWQQRIGDAEFEKEVYSYYGQEMPEKGSMQIERTPSAVQPKEQQTQRSPSTTTHPQNR